MTEAEQYSKFRRDGWPLCPRCGEDELFSLAMPATIDTIVGCYGCNWKPRTKPERKVIVLSTHERFRPKPKVEITERNHFRCNVCGHEWRTIPRIDDAMDRYRIPACPHCEPELS